MQLCTPGTEPQTKYFCSVEARCPVWLSSLIWVAIMHFSMGQSGGKRRYYNLQLTDVKTETKRVRCRAETFGSKASWPSAMIPVGKERGKQVNGLRFIKASVLPFNVRRHPHVGRPVWTQRRIPELSLWSLLWPWCCQSGAFIWVSSQM